MKKLVLSILLVVSTCFAEDSILKERLLQAKSGDFIVTKSNKMISLLAIRSISGSNLVLEEITLNAKEKPDSWAEWIQKGAPKHTSWSMLEVDLLNNQLLECYSFSKGAWLQINQQESALATLLKLSLQPVPSEKRRHIGPPPSPGEADHRKFWNPPFLLDGKQQEGTSFLVFEGAWPEDHSELSGQNVVVYYDQNGTIPFPTWVEVETAHATAHLQTIDSGHRLPLSPHRTLPRRIPEFVGTPQKTQSGLRLCLKSPKYYRSFELFAVDITTKEKEIHPLTHSLINGQDDLLNLEIDEEELRQTLKPDHRYTWLVVPIGHNENYTESLKPFLFKGL